MTRRNCDLHWVNKYDGGSTQSTIPSDWSPRVEEHIAANFSDGFYIGEVLEVIDDDTIKVSYMSPKLIMTAVPDEHKRRFWIWPSNRDIFNTDRSCIINLNPSLSLLEIPPSTKRQIVFSCLNAEHWQLVWRMKYHNNLVVHDLYS